ncbi:hypothetical protein SLA2020_478050 [Shorea laevis]
MAGMIRTAQTIILSASPKSLMHGGFRRPAVASFVHSRPYATEVVSNLPLEANILRILRNEIQYQLEYAPPHQPATKFNTFTAQNQSGEHYITMKGKYGDNEDVHLHISLLVDISKGQDHDELEFWCSAWPDSLEIQKVYLLRREKMMAGPYMGRDFRNLSMKLQKTLREYLEARGVNDELFVFLHEYMTNNDRVELINWLSAVKSCVEK